VDAKNQQRTTENTVAVVLKKTCREIRQRVAVDTQKPDNYCLLTRGNLDQANFAKKQLQSRFMNFGRSVPKRGSLVS